jgi:hypothetical protein
MHIATDIQLDINKSYYNSVSVYKRICIYVCIYLYKPNKLNCDAKYLYTIRPVVSNLCKHKYIPIFTYNDIHMIMFVDIHKN